MMRVSIGIIITVVMSLLLVSGDLTAQNIYELRQLTNDDWLNMSTDERLSALNVSNNHSYNQTFFGDFGRDYDRYTRWGYDYYEMEDRYENYAFRGFENYNIVETRRERWYYNQFGDRLTKMTRNGYIWSETIRDDGLHDLNGPVGFINQQVFDSGIWVARESTEDWAVSVIGARSIRATLTPLTFSIPNYTGMKVDFQSENYSASIINAVRYGKDVFEKGQRGDKVLPATEANSLFVRGLQLRRKFGGLTLGATYANMHNIQMNRNKGNDLRGNVDEYNPTPMVYAVRIVDDSPQDGDGPIVQDVKLKVNGQYRPDIVPTVLLDDLRREKVTAVKAPAEQGYFYRGGNPNSIDYLSVDEVLMKHLDYLYYTDYTKGVNTDIVSSRFDINKGKEYYKYIDPGTKPIQVSGNEYIVYLFDVSSIGDEVERVQVEVTVANDYRVQTSTIYTIQNSIIGHAEDGGKYMTHYNSEFWRTMAQAEGNIKDGSNLRTITIDYGFEVANMIYGFDAQFNYLGFVVNAEFVANTHYYMFKEGVPGTGKPTNFSDYISEPNRGQRFTQTDNAYYITVRKDWERWGFAGELFKMGKFYRPYMNMFIPEEVSTSSVNSSNNHVRWSMVEDNDDDDQYPDTQTISEAMGFRVGGFQDPDGVFPGNDLDKDGYPDNEKNGNRIPDYDEPFLMFDVDPDEFVFGDDFNNNSIPDFREDDMKYDVPYDLDRKGQHFYLKFKPIRDVNLFAGSFKTRGIGLDTRTDNDYLKANLDYDVYTVGRLFAEYRYERINDNIQDKFVIYSPGRYVAHGGSRRYGSRSLFYDEIEYRNSKVQKVFVDLKLRASPAITLENHVKFERNDQVEGTMYDNTYQPADVLSTIAMINKFAYTKQLGNWVFTPGIKFRLYKKGRSESLNPLDHYLMRIPMVYLKYVFSPKTTLTFGMQGVKGLEMTFKDYIQSRNDYKQVNYILQIENRTNYFGFDLWGGFGFMLEEVKYAEIHREFEEYKTSSFFVRMWLGY